jgi:MFS family permease
MCAQGAVWYCAFFYIQIFLEKSLGVAPATVNLIVLVMTIISAPLYVFFGWLGDRVGRKPVMVGAMLLALVAYFPGFHAIAGAVNPAQVEAQQRTPVVVYTNRDKCSVQFDPVGTAQFKSACDIAKSNLASIGVNYSTRPSADGSTRIAIGSTSLAVADGSHLDSAGLKAAKADVGKQVKAALQSAGYPAAADPSRIDYLTLGFWLLVFVVAATALYGPQAAALVEMFPTRVRYTAMSLPYHVGTGWVGGFLPVTSFALVAISGNIYQGLWYSVAFTAVSLVVSLLFLPETKGKPLEQC